MAAIRAHLQSMLDSMTRIPTMIRMNDQDFLEDEDEGVPGWSCRSSPSRPRYFPRK
jgi:hypothetical protein